MEKFKNMSESNTLTFIFVLLTSIQHQYIINTSLLTIHQYINTSLLTSIHQYCLFYKQFKNMSESNTLTFIFLIMY